MDITYTTEEYNEFKRLYMATGSHDKVKRISARMDMSAFEKLHGRDKCQAMFDRTMYGERSEEVPDEGEAA